MIIIVKGRSNVGKSSLSTRLAAALGLEAPAWPLTPEMLAEWERGLRGWVEGLPEFIAGSNHIDTDRVVALCLFRNAARFEPPPAWTPTTPREAFEDWRDRTCTQLLNSELRHECFRIVCGMIDGARHAVVEGTTMGTNAVDSPFSKLLLFRYAQVPVVKVLLTRTPYDSPPIPVGVEVVRTAYVNGRPYTPDELVASFERQPDGEVVVPPHFLSRAAVGSVGRQA